MAPYLLICKILLVNNTKDGHLSRQANDGKNSGTQDAGNLPCKPNSLTAILTLDLRGNDLTLETSVSIIGSWQDSGEQQIASLVAPALFSIRLTWPMSLPSPDLIGEGDDSIEVGQPDRKMLWSRDLSLALDSLCVERVASSYRAAIDWRHWRLAASSAS
jgi:hypothetical protein